MNYKEKGRSSYFTVKDKEALEKWADLAGVDIEEKEGKFAVFAEESLTTEDEEGNRIPSIIEAAEEFLADGEIVVWTYAYSEGMRYMGGGAFCFNNKGEMCQLETNDIYEMAAVRFGVPAESIPKAEY
jgi:hypothetical protein